jgi:hypothetical protein
MKRIFYFFSLWGTYHYETRIGVRFAWELARIFAEHDEELSQWEELK